MNQTPLSWDELIASINDAKTNPADTAWNIYFYLKANVPVASNAANAAGSVASAPSASQSSPVLTSEQARTLLAIYMKMGLPTPSRLHSSYLSVAIRMSQAYSDFKFVQFLNLWGGANLRKEDCERMQTRDGRTFPSLLDRLAKAYMLYAFNHPDEQLAPNFHNVILGAAQRLGYQPSVIMGYVENIDPSHSHIHVYDSASRHFVADMRECQVPVGQYVSFIPVIPTGSKFKSAIINNVYPSGLGAELFGYHNAKVTYVDKAKGYASWELTDGTVLQEYGTTAPSFTKGYIHANEGAGVLPNVGDTIRLIAFLKRGKDGQKRPYVVEYNVIPR